MTTYDFSMKSVMCYLEYNERFKKNMLRVSQVGGRGGVRYLGRWPKYGFIFKWAFPKGRVKKKNLKVLRPPPPLRQLQTYFEIFLTAFFYFKCCNTTKNAF